MVNTNGAADRGWGRLAERIDQMREPEMLRRYEELIDLPEEERQEKLGAMAQAEYALPDPLLREMTRSRIKASR